MMMGATRHEWVANPRLAPNEGSAQRRSSTTSTVQTCTPIGSTAVGV
jgi:hypothetical protein